MANVTRINWDLDNDGQLDAANLANASGGGGGGNTYTLISSGTTTDTQASIDFNSISQDYDTLFIRVWIRNNSSNALNNALKIYFNSDTTDGNYFHQRLNGFNGGSTTTEGALPSISVVADGTSIAGTYVYTEITIPDYTSTNFLQTALSKYNGATADGGEAISGTYTAYHTSATAAVTDVQLVLNASTFGAGCNYELYGITYEGGGSGSGSGSGGGVSTGARVTKTAPTTIADATFQILNFDAEDYDTENYHDNVTNNSRLTTPGDGIYIVQAIVEFANNSTGDRIAVIRRNGNIFEAITRQVAAGSFNSRIYIATVCDCTAGDYFELGADQTSGGNLDVLTANTWFAITKITGGGGGGDLDVTQILNVYAGASINTLPDAVSTDVVFDVVDIDTESGYNVSTGEYTFGADTICSVEVGMAFDGGVARAGRFEPSLILNGTDVIAHEEQYVDTDGDTNNFPASMATIVRKFEAGDVIKLRPFHSLGGTQNLRQGDFATFMRIFEITGGGGGGGGGDLTVTRESFRHSAQFPVTGSATTAVTFDTAVTTETLWNKSTGAVLSDGIYYVEYQSQIKNPGVAFNDDIEEFRVNLKLNGTTLAISNYESWNNVGFNGPGTRASTIVELTAGDLITFDVFVWDNSLAKTYNLQEASPIEQFTIVKLEGGGSGSGSGSGGGTAWTLDNIKHKMLFGLIDGDTTDISNAALTTQTVTNVPSTSLDGTINKTVFNFAATTHLAYNFPLDESFTYAVFVTKINGADSIRRLANAYTTNNFFNISLDMAGEVTSIVYKPIQDNFPSSTDTFITYDWTGVDESQWRIWIYSVAHGTSKAQVDGSIMNISTTGSSTVDSSPSTYLNVNGFLSAPATPDGIGDGSTWDCWAALFLQDIGQSELDKVVGYLAHEAGLTANLPTNHPYKIDPPLVSSGSGSGDAAVSTGARVTHSVNQTISTATPVDAAFDTEAYDDGAYHDTITNNERLTVPADGKYLIIGQAEWAGNATGQRIINIQKNNSTTEAIVRTGTGTSTTFRHQITVLCDCVAGDYFTMEVNQTSGGNLDLQSGNTFFSINAIPGGGSGGGGREVLTADRTYYVATTGSDSNDGLTVGNPFLTIQKAIDVMAELDTGPHNITIQLADGTYTLTTNLIPKEPNGTGRVTILGNTGDRTLTVVSGGGTVGGGGLFSYNGFTNNRKYIIDSITVENFANDLCAVTSNQNALSIANCDFNAPMGSGRRVIYLVGDEIYINMSGTINFDLTGASPRSAIETLGINCHARCQGTTFTVSGSPTFSKSMFAIERVSRCNAIGATATGTFTGTGIATEDESVTLISGATSIPNGTSTANGGVILSV